MERVVGRWLCVGIALLSACASVHSPPATAGGYEGPLGSRDISRGGQIFRDFCNPCHAGRVNPRGYLWSPAQMRRQIREGNAAMPGIKDVCEMVQLALGSLEETMLEPIKSGSRKRELTAWWHNLIGSQMNKVWHVSLSLSLSLSRTP